MVKYQRDTLVKVVETVVPYSLGREPLRRYSAEQQPIERVVEPEPRPYTVVQIFQLVVV